MRTRPKNLAPVGRAYSTQRIDGRVIRVKSPR
jgi:hypothetical protein